MEPLAKAEILIEALPYIKEVFRENCCYKYGGHAMTNAKLKDLIIQDIILMKFVGINPVIVHGGGPEINYWLDKPAKLHNL